MTPQRGKLKSAFFGFGLFGKINDAVLSIPERKLGGPHMILDAQLESLHNQSQVKPLNATLHITLDNLPQVLKEKWWFWFDDRDENWPDLIIFE